MTYNDVDGIACAFVNCCVMEYEYVSDDRNGHNVVIGNVFERHSSCYEKAGDVVFHLKTNFGNARLVNRHNCDEGKRHVLLSCVTENLPAAVIVPFLSTTFPLSTNLVN